LLARYKAGNCNKKEADELLEWLADPANQKEVEEDIKASFGQTLDSSFPKGDVGERIWQQLVKREKIVDTSAKPKTIDIANSRNPFRTWRNIAAALIPLFIIMGLWFANNNPQPVKQVQENNEVWITKTAPKGRRLNLKLTDGSTIYLHANTTIRFLQDIHLQEVREVYLDSGEAFFDVAKVGTPFKVYAGDQEVAVMGTSFTVENNAYNKKKNGVKVAVLTGKVKVGKEGREGEILVRGDGVEVAGGKARRWQIRDLDTEFAWKDGVLAYKDASFDEVVSSLERWYGVEIVVPKGFEAAHKHFQGRYHNQSLRTVLEGFAHVSGCNYMIKSDTVYLTEKAIF